MERLTDRQYPIEVEGPEGLVLAILLARIQKIRNKSSLVVVPTETEADILLKDLSLVCDNAVHFPWWGTVPYSEASPHPSVSGERIKILADLASGKPTLVVTPLRSLLHPVLPLSEMLAHVISVSKGSEIDPIELEQSLSKMGYMRVPHVSIHGEFALRGEVVDVFLPGMEEATRIVFDFDTVEDIRLFDPITQVSSHSLDNTEIFPVKEILWSEERFANLTAYLKTRKDVSPETYNHLIDAAEKGECSGESFLFPVSYTDPGSILDFFQDDSLLFLIQQEHLQNSFESLKKEFRELYAKARSNLDYFVPPPSRLLLDFDAMIEQREHRIVFPAIKSPKKDTGRLRFSYEGPRSFFGNVDYLKEELSRLSASGYEVTIFADTRVQASRIEHLLKDFPVTVVPAGISHGFVLPDQKIMAIQEEEIFGRRKRRPKSVKTVRSASIDTFVELNPGDFVVHVNYGIGKFEGIERIQAVGSERDYIQLAYAEDETLFVPIEQVNLVQRYIGQEGRAPRLDKIGGKSWESRKNRVQKSVEDLAEMLLSLYSRRKAAQGYAFPIDTDWQLEFEVSFPFEETEDQLRCIEEVKADMEKPVPMDRLVCGDVGYGKTEVAVRASFKAVTGGRQVAFLAPTTILTEQHYETFMERYRGYPVNIQMLSRFVSRSDQKKTLQKLSEGEVDVLIGTHRLLQRDVKFKNLGLLVVDEEQRFGVKDKERLKELKTNVDCLTLSATPIPRTLHMSLLKLRDMSLLTTPPHNRRPIETLIRQFDEELVAASIRREMEREGQIYYLHNRVETLPNVKQFIEQMVPHAVVEVAHGQMSGEDLEDIMHRFIHNGFHVLVATTIIENGIDIPNVNTIIIDRADMFGISQLYQLRGRVGRSDRLAYAYLLYPEEQALSELAMKRLQVISDHTELGSGFKVALRDLEVRGAGNLLGRQQHGDILSVGFDMYVRLLDRAIADMSEDESDEAPDVFLELEYSGYIPDRYIQEPAEKMEVYKKIASISAEEELEAVLAELLDRYGPQPDEVQSLMALAEIRILCKKLKIGTLRERRGVVEIEFSRVADISIERVMRLINESEGKIKPDAKRPNVLKMEIGKVRLSEKSEYLRERLAVLI